MLSQAHENQSFNIVNSSPSFQRSLPLSFQGTLSIITLSANSPKPDLDQNSPHCIGKQPDTTRTTPVQKQRALELLKQSKITFSVEIIVEQDKIIFHPLAAVPHRPSLESKQTHHPSFVKTNTTICTILFIKAYHKYAVL